MRLLAFAACLLVLQRSQAWIDVNDQLDNFLPKLNAVLTREGYGIIPFPDKQISNINITGNYLIGLNSLYRSGPSVIQLDEQGLLSAVDLHIGFRLCTLAFTTLTSSNFTEPFSGTLRIQFASIYQNFFIQKIGTADCKVSLNDFKFEELTDAILDSTNMDLHHVDVSEFMLSDVQPAINKELTDKHSQVEAYIQQYVCQANFTSIPTPENIADAFAELLYI